MSTSIRRSTGALALSLGFSCLLATLASADCTDVCSSLINPADIGPAECTEGQLKQLAACSECEGFTMADIQSDINVIIDDCGMLGVAVASFDVEGLFSTSTIRTSSENTQTETGSTRPRTSSVPVTSRTIGTTPLTSGSAALSDHVGSTFTFSQTFDTTNSTALSTASAAGSLTVTPDTRTSGADVNSAWRTAVAAAAVGVVFRMFLT
ncbi:hypothetical protein HMN09_01392500 [Mycena chlorophos]|uniref:Extracellular membrane protein CFEM domain-containing protein n=1 Tax=Mycena chlorophos TaxID=658473 RepID=A0A8H6RZ99_MYCCL|nr:hypothetical protein HMN09_01392500 [Mycena chlorophos]